MPVDVVLNVYDLMDQTSICCGFFHTGVEIMGTEWSFAGGAGVYDCSPRSAPDGRFRQSIVLGQIESTVVARMALDLIRPQFHGDAYRVIFRNCNDFSSAYSKALLGRDIPGWINRLARIGRAWPVRCFLPARLRAGGDSATAPQAPLLASRQQAVFQGEGRSLSGVSSGGGSGRSRVGRLLSRVTRLFRRGDGPSASTVGAGAGDARELRAAAAARRFGPSGEDARGGDV